MLTFFIAFSLFFLFLAILGQERPRVIGHWDTLIDQFKFSTSEFYKLVYEELKSHDIPDLDMTTVEFSESSMLSHKRRYLRITWKDYIYDCCFAPFGSGSFVSWWLLYKTSNLETGVSNLPFIGKWLQRFFFPDTYYRRDTASMFIKYAQSSILKVLEQVTEGKGLSHMSETEKKPILKDIFDR